MEWMVEAEVKGKGIRFSMRSRSEGSIGRKKERKSHTGRHTGEIIKQRKQSVWKRLCASVYDRRESLSLATPLHFTGNERKRWNHRRYTDHHGRE